MTDNFPAALKALREGRGLSLYALAKLTGIDATQLGRYESSQREPKLSSMSVLANALGCTLDELAGRDAPGQ